VKALDKYLDLVRKFPLRPVRSENDLDRAIAVVNGLIDRPALSRMERDYLEVLGRLVREYEAQHIPMPEVSDDRMLRHLMEAKEVNQSEVARATRIANSTISAVLAGQRRLTREQLGRLSDYFHVEPGVFLFSGQANRMASADDRAGKLVDA
jgi:HTH-type transcriptional regulator/antitoxin HigA